LQRLFNIVLGHGEAFFAGFGKCGQGERKQKH
jgi:hypothetical protein